MKPSFTTMSDGGAVPIFVPPERSRYVWYAAGPLPSQLKPTSFSRSQPLNVTYWRSSICSRIAFTDVEMLSTEFTVDGDARPAITFASHDCFVLYTIAKTFT